jgi:N4-gp56 family major capsid protein
MATTSFGVNDTLAVKLWSKSLAVAEREYLDIAPLIGESEDSIIQMKTETRKGAGDRVTFPLQTLLTGAGMTEGETAEGNGEALSLYADNLLINELGHVVGVKSENTIDAQRVQYDLRELARNGLGRWWAMRKSVSFFNQVCGNTAQTNTKFTGLNATTAPAGTGRQIWAGTAANDQSLTSSDVFTLDLIDAAVEAAKVGDNMVRPIMVGGQPKYVMYLHPYQVTAMRTNSASGQWMDIAKAAMMGGQITNNPIYTGALGEYNGVVLRSSQDVTLGCSSAAPTTAVANTRRAVLLGAQAAVVAYGQNNSGPSKYRWNEELLDHKRKLEVSAWCICGMKKVVFNSSDFGTVVVSTYAAAST